MPAIARLGGAVLGVVVLAHAALAQNAPAEPTLELTPAGKAILANTLLPGGMKPREFFDGTMRVPMCAFHGGLCGAMNQDGSIAVPPRYDWVGDFYDGRAAVRLGGLYGFVDTDGREIVKPQYRLVGDYQYGFAQVDVDGKSGLIDRDGKMVFEPKYGFIQAVAPDRFCVSDARLINGEKGAEKFGDGAWGFCRQYLLPPSPSHVESRIIDGAGRLIEIPIPPKHLSRCRPPPTHLTRATRQFAGSRRISFGACNAPTGPGSWRRNPRKQIG